MTVAANWPTQPAIAALAVTPSDTVGITNGECRALYIGVTGDVTLLDVSGNVTTFKAVPVGILPVACKRVNATLTTATNIVALY